MVASMVVRFVIRLAHLWVDLPAVLFEILSPVKVFNVDVDRNGLG